MRWSATVLLLAIALFGAGCSNAPIAGTMDCFFPSKARYKTEPRPGDDDRFPPRPRDRDSLPDPEPGPFERDRGRVELPRIGQPFRPSSGDAEFTGGDDPWKSRKPRSAELPRLGTPGDPLPPPSYPDG